MSQLSPRAERSDPHAVSAPSYLWEVPGKPIAVKIPFDLIDRLEREAVENFRSIDSRGSEIGGLLFGAAAPAPGGSAPAVVWIEDYELVSCDYSRGPLYRLSEADVARLDATAQRRAKGDSRVVGFFRSHTRKGLALDAEDMSLIETRFRDPEQIVLLVRPFATRSSAAGIFIREGGQMRGDASYLEFPFRSAELMGRGSAEPATPAPLGVAAPPLAPPPARPVTRAQVVPMAPRLKVTLPPPPPASPAHVAQTVAMPSVVQADAPPPPPQLEKSEPIPVKREGSPRITTETPPKAAVRATAEPTAPANAAPPVARAKAAASVPSEKVTEPVAPDPVAKPVTSRPAPSKPPAEPKRSRMPLVWGVTVLALVVSSGALFIYPGLLRHTNRPHEIPAGTPLTLRVERTATDLLLTWNRDSEAIRKAKSAVLSISDGERQENVQMNLADLRNGSIMYSPLTPDTSFRMEITGPDGSKTAAESVRMLRPERPSPLAPTDAHASPTPASENKSAHESPAAANTGGESESAPEPAPARRVTKAFNADTLAQRLRSAPAQPSDIPDAPALGRGPAMPSVNLGAIAPSPTALPAPATRESAAPREVARNIQQAELVSRVNPEYPDIARRRSVTGVVRVSARIGKNGKIISVTPLSGPLVLQPAAVSAVKQWVYRPALLDGKPTESEKEIDLNFTLR